MNPLASAELFGESQNFQARHPKPWRRMGLGFMACERTTRPIFFSINTPGFASLHLARPDAFIREGYSYCTPSGCEIQPNLI